jgi:hypothetical protein
MFLDILIFASANNGCYSKQLMAAIDQGEKKSHQTSVTTQC